MSKIWVTNNSGHNLEPALKYGDDIIYLTEGKVNIFRTDDLIEDMREKLKGFKKEDYLVFTGNSVVAGICLAILFTRFKTVKKLLYNVHTTEYVPRNIEKGRLTLPEEEADGRLED